jgi:hypothetical protein
VEEWFIKENKNWSNASFIFFSLHTQNNHGRPVVAFEIKCAKQTKRN